MSYQKATTETNSKSKLGVKFKKLPEVDSSWRGEIQRQEAVEIPEVDISNTKDNAKREKKIISPFSTPVWGQKNGIAADKTKGLPWASPRWPFSSVPRNDLGNVVGLQQQYRRGDPGPSNSGGLGDPSRFRLNGYDGTGMYQPQNPLPDNDNQVFNEEHQMKMSFRQLNYDRLSSQEKKEQDNWAHSELARLVPCPMGYGWRRVRGGYRCKGGENTPKNAESLRTGGTHLVTDELLSRRQGEFYLLSVFVRHYEKTVQFPGIKGRWTGPETINSFRVQKQLQAKYGRQYGDAPGGPPMYRYDQFGRIQGQSPFNRNEGRRL